LSFSFIFFENGISILYVIKAASPIMIGKLIKRVTTQKLILRWSKKNGMIILSEMN
jgi:hypothetical protein